MKSVSRNYYRPIKEQSEHLDICPDIRAVLFLFLILFSNEEFFFKFEKLLRKKKQLFFIA